MTWRHLHLALALTTACGTHRSGTAAVEPGQTAPPRTDSGWVERKEERFILRYKRADSSLVPSFSAKLVAGCRTVETFFGKSFRRPLVVHLVPTREELTLLWRKLWGAPSFEAQCWMVASGNEDLVAVLSPRVWPTEACEHDAKNERHVQNVLTHELTHAYHDQYNPRRDFAQMEPLAWFAEGLATYVAGQLREGHLLPASEAFSKGLAPTRLADAHRGKYRYGVSGSLVEFLDARHGREVLGRLLVVVDQAEALAVIGDTEQELLRDWRRFVTTTGGGRAPGATDGAR